MRKLFLSAALFIAAVVVYAGNIDVTDAGLTAQDSTASPAYTKVKFDLSWEDSWRMSAGPANWDAAWVFVKYKLPGQDWKHATLSTDPANHSITSGGANMSIQPSSDGKGVFVYRSVDGTGNISLDDVLLQWDYATDGVANSAQVRVQVFAIEMVWVPKGPFFIGDGNMTTPPACYSTSYGYRRNNSAGIGYMPYLVNSESAITFVNSSASDVDKAYDPWRTAGYTLPASYPKGFDGFYIMKYEISQEQYADFFNTLPNTSVRNTRWISPSSSYRNYMSWSGTPTDDINTAFTGRWRACNYINFSDGCAYADWAALRPMTELEFEKACRGTDNTDTNNRKPIFPTNGEFPWGTTSINYSGTTTLSMTDDGGSGERLSSPTQNYNAHLNNTSPSSYTNGPVRNGFFAYRTSWPTSPPATERKRHSGASYYGVMEMAGNLKELVVPTFYYYYSYAATFNGENGDGQLSSNGHANVSGWLISGQPEVANSAAASYWQGGRGGGYSDYYQYGYVSNREYMSTYTTGRQYFNGFRCVRKP